MPPKRGRKTPAVPVKGGWVLPHGMGPIPSETQPATSSNDNGSGLHTASSSSKEKHDTTNAEAAVGEDPQELNAKDSAVKPEAPATLAAAPNEEEVLPTEGRKLRPRKDKAVETQGFDQVIQPTLKSEAVGKPQDLPTQGRQLRSRKTTVKTEHGEQTIEPALKTEEADKVTQSTSASGTIDEAEGLLTEGRKLRPRKAKVKTEDGEEATQPTSAEDAAEFKPEPDSTSVNPKKRKARGKKDPTEPKKPRKKARKTADNPYGLTPGETPFPEFEAPSAEQCELVFNILSEMHGEVQAQAPEVIPAPSLEVAGCGEVPSVLDALIRTLLSGAVTFAGAAKMIKGLTDKFGILEEGIGKGSINWNNVRLAKMEDVVAAIKAGGLANNKAKSIKGILDMVHEDNLQRRDAYLEEKKTGVQADVLGAAEKTEGQKDLEILKAEQNILSLDHLRGLSAGEAMLHFTKYPGVGVKTSACVILFCLQLPCFAVDTHVAKFAKWLRWAPEKASENDIFGHLEVRCPDRLKYGLHQLFIRHGQTCGRCKRNTVVGTADWDKIVCPLEDLLVRTGKKMAKPKPETKGKGKGKGKDKGEGDGEAEVEDENENEGDEDGQEELDEDEDMDQDDEALEEDPDAAAEEDDKDQDEGIDKDDDDAEALIEDVDAEGMVEEEMLDADD
ncbi:DNA glycosylase [Xylariomycetidae sp. FL2044]|nr:DNA glycosylase [Xylariomycetidae sp. FL2044]